MLQLTPIFKTEKTHQQTATCSNYQMKEKPLSIILCNNVWGSVGTSSWTISVFFPCSSSLSLFQLSSEVTVPNLFRGILSGLSKVETNQGKMFLKKTHGCSNGGNFTKKQFCPWVPRVQKKELDNIITLICGLLTGILVMLPIFQESRNESHIFL